MPTGKTPEFFIKWVKHIIQGWTKEGTELRSDRVVR
jgi:hypothetical protein